MADNLGTVKTVPDAFERAKKQFDGRVALKVKRNGAWQSLTWAEYYDTARKVAKAFIKLGLKPHQGVAIIGYNSPEWLMADLGAILAGGVPAGIYTTSTADQAHYIAHHSEAGVLVGENDEQVQKFLSRKADLPHHRAIVQMEGTPKDPTVLSWEKLLKLADEVKDEVLEERIAAQKPNDTATLIYTSGTTGDPKAVMITHENIVWTADALVRGLGFGSDDVGVSYLPLSHIAEQMITIHGPIRMGASIAFSESVEKLPEALKDIRPTYFLGVPRVWEKMQAKMVAAGSSASPLRKKLVVWAKSMGLRGGYADQNRTARPLLFPLAEKLIFSKVRERLGLDRARFCVTAAAPISKDTLEFFLSLGIPILEVYGMSECTGPATYSPPDAYKTGLCGVVIPGGEIKIAEDGEVLMRGPHVFRGYYKDPESTRAALDEDGWLHSGDIGTIDKDGYLKITDRKKDLLITAGGENIAPQLIEGILKSIPIIAQAVVVGDRQKYLAALLTLDAERLEKEAVEIGSPARTLIQAAACPIFRAHIQTQIEVVNGQLARVQTIKKFEVIGGEFSIDGGELTPTMKIKRKVIGEKYKAEIASLYA
jgi:long-subunit acyl-CoA synthetase (AMP-forming)